MSSNQTLIAVPLFLILGAATLWDWRERRIPNVLSFGSALFGLALQVSLHGAGGAVLAVGGWLVCLVCFLPFHARGGMAAGDVKLMAAVGAFMGPVPGLVACVFTLIAGGLIGLMSLAYAWSARAIVDSPAAAGVAWRDTLKTRIPYAGAIAAGTSLVLLVPSVIPPALTQLGA